jgi:hypothetical protein
MKIGYLVLASERRIIFTKVDDNVDICNAIGCREFCHGTTFITEDQLVVNGDRMHGMPEHWFRVERLSLEFSGIASGAEIRRSMDEPAGSE